MPSWMRMDGRATPTIDTSRPSRNSTPHNRISAPHSRGVHAVEVRAPGRTAPVSGLVVAVEVTGHNLHAEESNAREFNAVDTCAVAWVGCRGDRERARAHL